MSTHADSTETDHANATNTHQVVPAEQDHQNPGSTTSPGAGSGRALGRTFEFFTPAPTASKAEVKPEGEAGEKAEESEDDSAIVGEKGQMREVAVSQESRKAGLDLEDWTVVGGKGEVRAVVEEEEPMGDEGSVYVGWGLVG